ncbi:MAG: preprotein translocase subunit SecG [Proteobacteria bacterium]|uniref:Protein-export membrane protein SecG n=1 Tax=SAR86 cluster bacterium TaxID=2030880 RepID=A0A937LK43_9GAMM|nr:preprotein translocase subunit SecG [SAR86 cluster bacterium]MBL6819698.1 preprotein translocase subunit SecG [SAR86 cluster bacterium]MDA0345567.1 preprotein translocase subunit SecG [Pseudomonadota bacterium]MDA0899407.1 preprotein translocase subunit SecG [Pseudomonadota bacterium]
MIFQVLIIILAVLIVASIMLQQGKGSDLGSAFGGGSSDSIFGPLGPGNFLSKATWGMVAAFFILCLTYAYLSKQELTLTVQEVVEEQPAEEPPTE